MGVVTVTVALTDRAAIGGAITDVGGIVLLCDIVFAVAVGVGVAVADIYILLNCPWLVSLLLTRG